MNAKCWGVRLDREVEAVESKERLGCDDPGGRESKGEEEREWRECVRPRSWRDLGRIFAGLECLRCAAGLPSGEYS